MYQIEIDKSLKCNIFSSSDKGIENRTNIIYVPGLGTIGKTRIKIVERAIQIQSDINIITFLYKSHQGNTLNGLEGDIDDLGEVVHKLEKFGLPRNNIGFLGVCYGAYLTAQHLSKEDEYKYALMIEPFLGKESLKSYAKLVFKFGEVLSILGMKNIPVGNRHNKEKGYANFESVINAISKEIPTFKATPLLALATDYHGFLDKKYIEDWVIESGGTFKFIKERSKVATLNSITHEMNIFKEAYK